jgi:hypothetical protein
MMHRLTPITALAAAAILSLSSAGANAAVDEAKLVYKQAQDNAAASYKVARARCDAIAGNPKDVCIAEAKAARVRAEEEAGAYYKNTLKAYTASRMKIADAQFDLDKAKCGAYTGNEKDVCVSQAKATMIATQADAKADKKAMEARADAREDKRTAEYKVAREKCDSISGATKDSCVSAGKAQYGK